MSCAGILESHYLSIVSCVLRNLIISATPISSSIIMLLLGGRKIIMIITNHSYTYENTHKTPVGITLFNGVLKVHIGCYCHWCSDRCFKLLILQFGNIYYSKVNTKSYYWRCLSPYNLVSESRFHCIVLDPRTSSQCRPKTEFLPILSFTPNFLLWLGL